MLKFKSSPIMSTSLLATLLLLTASTTRADIYADTVEQSLATLHTDENSAGVGAGVAVSSARAGVGKVVRFNLLVGTQYHDVPHGCGNDDLTIQRNYAFEVSGTATFAPSAGGTEAQMLDIEFDPIQKVRRDTNVETFTTPAPSDISEVRLRALNTHLGRNIRLDQKVSLRISAVGVSSSNHLSHDTHNYFKVAIDALGYKLASYYSTHAFHGLDVASAHAEIGRIIKVSRGTLLRVALGGSADVALGAPTDLVPSVQSDGSAYAEASLDVGRYLQFFARSGANFTGYAAHDGDHVFNGELVEMAGALLKY